MIATSSPAAGRDATWRISIATVRDGAAFSLFPEYERILLPLESGSIALVAPAGQVRPYPDGASRFSGAVAVTACVPGGEAFALNVMVVPTHAAPLLRRRALDGTYANDDPAVRASVLVRGSVLTPGGGVVGAPAVLAPGVRVSATGAEIVEVVLDHTAEPNAQGTP